LVAHTISTIICTLALVILIAVLPPMYGIATANINDNMVRRELAEITEYTSNTFGNLFVLANSTNLQSLNLTKQLTNLPASIENSAYGLNLTSVGGKAVKIVAYLISKPSVSAEAWLAPGLKSDNSSCSIQSGPWSAVAGCLRNSTGFYAWIKKGV